MTPRMDWGRSRGAARCSAESAWRATNALLRKHQRASVVAVVNGSPIRTVAS
jgi:hypothetical protein